MIDPIESLNRALVRMGGQPYVPPTVAVVDREMTNYVIESLTASYQAEIEALEQHVKTLEGHVETLEKRLRED
jgi:hypothetical protein